MAKNLKLKIKNSQLAKAAGLDKLKEKLARKTGSSKKEDSKDVAIVEKSEAKPNKVPSKLKAIATSTNLANTISSSEETPNVSQRRIRAKSRSSFASDEKEAVSTPPTMENEESLSDLEKEINIDLDQKEEIRAENNTQRESVSTSIEEQQQHDISHTESISVKESFSDKNVEVEIDQEEIQIPPPSTPALREKFGPTGKHINHLLAKAHSIKEKPYQKKTAYSKKDSVYSKSGHHSFNNDKIEKPHHNYGQSSHSSSSNYRSENMPHQGKLYHKTPSSQPGSSSNYVRNKPNNFPYSSKPLPKKEGYVDFNANKSKSFSQSIVIQPKSPSFPKKDVKKTSSHSDFKDTKSNSRKFAEQKKAINEKNWYGLSDAENEKWRKKKQYKTKDLAQQQTIQRPSQIKVRLPITIKDLAAELKLKASELIKKMFIHGMTYVLNDILDDETTVQFIGEEFSCNIIIDNSEKERIQIVSSSIKEEILKTDAELLNSRPPVVAFMGHVDHGKTSLIDAIRKSNRVAGEAGAITQHIGAFRCSTPVGTITILDTPGHEAFSAMRARGAEVCDIIVLVLAGDEGIKEQTLEAIEHAKNANITILVAINKSDKPNFNAENIFRQLADVDLLPEAWGGTTITVNTSAKTGEGVSELLEMLALQSEVLELKANPSCRARGLVIESQRHKGLGAVATVLVQNGTLYFGDAVVFNDTYGHIKTMTNEHGEILKEALPSTPVAITGLSDLPLAGDPFIVVKSEKEAKDIVSARIAEQQYSDLQKKKKLSFDKILQNKKILRLIIRADVQGSIEALANSIMKINSNKVDVEIVSSGIGEITESDINLAAASKATIIGFHTSLQNHAETLVKSLNVQIKLCNVIYHAIDEIKSLMKDLLDPIFEEKHLGSAEVKAMFKSSQLGVICGCLVIDGSITRSSSIKLKRDQEVIWKGRMASLKRVKEDVREVKKGLECGILLDGCNQAQIGDILETFEVISKPQEL